MTAPTRKKASHRKSRCGCLTCKRRHLKCDETRPTCLRCRSDKITCEGYGVLQKRGNVGNVKTEDLPPVASPPKNDEEAADEQLALLGRKKRQKSYHKKTRTGCVTCRRRRVKCDERRPGCLKCDRAGIVCEGYGPSSLGLDISGDDAGGSADTEIASGGVMRSSTPSSQTSVIITKYKHDEVALVEKEKEKQHSPISELCSVKSFTQKDPYASDAERLALKYWLVRTEDCQVFNSRIGDLNVLGIDIPQAAWQYGCIKYSLLAAACVTASLEDFNFSKDHYWKSSVRALNYSNAAIQSLFKENPPARVTALIAFVFWYTEAWYGSWETALSHLLASVKICQEAKTKGLIGEGVAWYIEAIGDGIPSALQNKRMVDMVSKTNEAKFAAVRLSYCMDQVRRGIAWIELVVTRIKPSSNPNFAKMLRSLRIHQEEMRWLLNQWESVSQCLTSLPLLIDAGVIPEIPLYHKVEEFVEDALARGVEPDMVILDIRLKALIRAVTLFAAGSNTTLRECAAGVVAHGALLRSGLSPHSKGLQLVLAKASKQLDIN